MDNLAALVQMAMESESLYYHKLLDSLILGVTTPLSIYTNGCAMYWKTLADQGVSVHDAIEKAKVFLLWNELVSTIETQMKGADNCTWYSTWPKRAPWLEILKHQLAVAKEDQRCAELQANALRDIQK